MSRVVEKRSTTISQNQFENLMMKFTSAVSFLVISWPFVMGQQCPFGPDGLISGTTYQVDENNSKWVILERNNGSQCPCSYVSIQHENL
jgi:hypothetical protein